MKKMRTMSKENSVTPHNHATTVSGHFPSSPELAVVFFQRLWSLWHSGAIQARLSLLLQRYKKCFETDAAVLQPECQTSVDDYVKRAHIVGTTFSVKRW